MSISALGNSQTTFYQRIKPDFKTYSGLGCNKYNDIIRITLTRNNLRGHLPAEETWVRTLVELRNIDLSQNQLIGDFPNTW